MEQDLINREMSNIFDQYFHRLPERNRRFIEMYYGFYGEELTLKSISVAEGISITRVRQIIKRGESRLLQMLLAVVENQNV